MLLKLNLNANNADNIIPFTAELSPPAGDNVQVIVLENGAAHAPFVVRLTSSGEILTRGVDWNYCYQSEHAKATFDIEAYAGIQIINKTLVGEINLTPNYLGGNYGVFDQTKVILTRPLPEVVNPLPWDSSLSTNIESADLSDTPAGRIDIALDDLISLLSEFKNIVSNGVNTAEVMAVLNQLVVNLQTKTVTIADATTDDIVELINTIFYELSTMSSSTFLDNVINGGFIVLPADISADTPIAPTYKKVLLGGELTYYHTGDQENKTTLLKTGDVFIIPAGGGTIETLTSRTEPLKHQSMVDPLISGVDEKDVSGALNAIKANADALKREYTFNGFLSETTNFTTLTGEDAWWYSKSAIQVTIPTQPNGDVQTLAVTNNQLVIREGNLYRIANTDDPVYKIPFFIPSLPGPDKTLSGEIVRINQQIDERKTKTGQVVYGVMGLELSERYRGSSEGQIPVNDALSPELAQLLQTTFSDDKIPSSDTGGGAPVLNLFTVTTGHAVEDVTFLNVGYSNTLTKFVLRLNITGVGHVLALCDISGESYTELSSVGGMDSAITDFKVLDNTLFYTVGQTINTVNLTTEAVVSYDYSGSVSGDFSSLIPFDEATGFYLAQLVNGDIYWLGAGAQVVAGAEKGLVYNETDNVVYYRYNGDIYWLPVPIDASGYSVGNLHIDHPMVESESIGVYVEDKSVLVYFSTGIVCIHKGENAVTVLQGTHLVSSPIWVPYTNKIHYIENGQLYTLSFAPSIRTYIRG